ncbi:MAG: 3D domain-containing protein [Desulfovibrionaceae bacterium]|jgi:3D (Asp-Asp-Asp) domain-containing protein|nr:3D domain-containing protein [Desulfovibrionaceae bacterium]
MVLRLFSAAAFVALALVAVHQQARVETLSDEVESYKNLVHRLERSVYNNLAATTLLQKVSFSNLRHIQTIRPKRIVTVTAYSPRTTETDDTPFQTASNRRVRHGIVAVSRDLFDEGWVFGRKVYIKELGIFTIEDLMAKEKRNQIDIFMFDTSQALKFGKIETDAYLLDLTPLDSLAKR